jgi:cysteine-rich repeat protein
MRIARQVPHNAQAVNAVRRAGRHEIVVVARRDLRESSSAAGTGDAYGATMRPPRTCHTFARVVVASALLGSAAFAAAPPVPGLSTVTLASPDTDLPIPDGDALVSMLDVDAPGTIIDVDLTVDLVHPQADQLDVFLVAPSGTTIALTTDNGAGNDDVFAGATFDDQASGTPSAPCVRNLTYVDAVPVGLVQPEEAMGAVVGEPASGPWVLVVVDDSGGQTGMLRSWSLAISTVPALHPSAPVTLAGAGGAIPDNSVAGRVSTIAVSGLPHLTYDVDVALDVRHPNAGDLDVFLTAPSGRRIDLVTDVGGGNDDLYAGATFDDQAGTAVSDETLPASGTAFAAVVPEGALSAFVGEDPNGTWTLTVADDAGGNTGTLNGWTLRLVTATVCGDGVLDAGEQCDDGNGTSGDGCDANCTATACGNGVVSSGEDCDDGNAVDGDACPSRCRFGEADCTNCVDDDGNGLVDVADPACVAAPLQLRSGRVVSGARGRAGLAGALALPATPAGSAGVLLADANGVVLCADVGALKARGRGWLARGRIGSGRATVKLVRRKNGVVSFTARAVDLGSLDDPTITFGLRLGADGFVGTAVFQARGRRFVR